MWKIYIENPTLFQGIYQVIHPRFSSRDRIEDFSYLSTHNIDVNVQIWRIHLPVIPRKKIGK